MHNHFASSCHFEGPREQEHERHSFGHAMGPSFCPYQPEHQEFFRHPSPPHFNICSYPMPEISIHIGPERPCEPEYFAGMQHSPPRFYGREQPCDNNYSYGSHYRFNNFRDRTGYSLNLNLNFDQGYNYGGNPNFDDTGSSNFGDGQNYANGQSYANSQNYADGQSYANRYDSNSNPGQSAGPGADISNDLVESTYGAPGITSPHINYGQAYDAPPSAAPTGDQNIGQAAPSAASSDDITAQVHWLVDHVPLGTADSADYIIIPSGATNYSDQVSAPTAAADTNSTDQVILAPSVDNTNAPPSPGTSDANAAAQDQETMPNVYGPSDTTNAKR